MGPADPGDFVTTAVPSSPGRATARLRAALQHTPGAGQKVGPLTRSAGRGHYPSTRRATSSSTPSAASPANAAAAAGARRYQAAPPSQQTRLDRRYTKASRTPLPGRDFRLPPGDYGPVAPMMAPCRAGPERRARRRPADDGPVLPDRLHQAAAVPRRRRLLRGPRRAQHLLGDQWGMMNETGSYPGQVWLWLYTFWYQIQPLRPRERRRPIWALMLVLSARLHLHPLDPRPAVAPRTSASTG